MAQSMVCLLKTESTKPLYFTEPHLLQPMGQGGKDKGLLLAFLYHFLWGAQPKDVQAAPQTVWRHMCEALR